MKKKLSIIVAFFIALIVLSFYFFQIKTDQGKILYQYNKKDKKEQINAVLIIEKNGKPYIKKKIIVPRGTTLLEALENSIGKITKRGEGKNAFIEEIAGIKAKKSKNEYWIYTVNGKTAEVGAGSFVIENNNKIVWKIQKY